MSTCPFDTRRDDLLISYLYDELDAAARAEFSAHLLQCTACRDEIAALKTVRTQLAAWTPPVFSHQPSLIGPGRQSWWTTMPAWAQVAAALLVLGVGAGAANLQIHRDQSGLTVRTGWMRAPDGGAVAPLAIDNAAAAPVAPAAVGASSVESGATLAAPWRGDLATLERQLRTEFHAQAVSRTASASDAETLRRVRALLDESERKQQRELALRIAEVVREVQSDRRADLLRIEQSLGQIQSNTGVEVMKQRQLLNYLVRVSQKQ